MPACADFVWTDFGRVVTTEGAEKWFLRHRHSSTTCARRDSDGAAYPVNLTTNQAKGSGSYLPETRCVRRAGCLETGLSRSTEAHGIQHLSGSERAIPVFYPMIRPRPSGTGRREHASHSTGSREAVAVEVVQIHPQGVRAHGVRSTAASVGSSVVATRPTGAHQPRRSGQIPDGEKLNHERPARACWSVHSETVPNGQCVNADGYGGASGSCPRKSDESLETATERELRTYGVQYARGVTPLSQRDRMRNDCH